MRNARKRRRTVAEYGPDPVDVHVGGRIRLRRTLLRMSQTDLGKALGLTFQQFGKYERGADRISASRLYQLSHILDVPVGYFFEGLKKKAPARSPDDVIRKRETLELVRAYYRIRGPKVREALHAMTKAMAKGAGSR